MLNKKTWLPLAGTIYLLVLILYGFFAATLIRADILPPAYTALLLIIVAVLLLFSGFLLFIGVNKKPHRFRSTYRTIGVVLSVLTAFCCFFCALVFLRVGQTVQAIAAPSGTSVSVTAGQTGGQTGTAKPGEEPDVPAETIAEKIANGHVMVFYLSGNDTRSYTLVDGRSDTNILMAVDPVNHQILLVNTPRDYYVENPAMDYERDKLTHCSIYGVGNAIAALERLYGIDIDTYVQINFAGFENLVDDIGGVTLYNPVAFEIEGVWFPAGTISLDGYEALKYVRARKTLAEGDFDRGRNQMRMVTAIIERVKSRGVGLLLNYADILSSLEGTFSTGLTAEEISALVRMTIGDLDAWEVYSCSVSYSSTGMMPTASTGDERLYVVWPSQPHLDHVASMIEKMSSGGLLTDDDLNGP